MRKSWLILPLSLMIVGCGSSSSTDNEKGSIDLSTYLESKDVSKNYEKFSKSKDAAVEKEVFTENSIVKNNKVERIINNVTNAVISIEETHVVKNDISTEGNTTSAFKRYVDEASTLFHYDINITKPLKADTVEVGTQKTEGTRTCQLLENLDGFTYDGHTYTGDIVKVRCTKVLSIMTTIKDEFVGQVDAVSGTKNVVDIFYMYSKKSTGLIAYLDDDCITSKNVLNDESDECNDENYQYEQYEHVYFLEN